MLNQLLHLDKPLFILDVESTGLDVQTARIIEIAFQQWGPEGLIKEWSSRVNPGIPIPPASTAIHHITDDDVKDAYTFRQLAPNLAKGFINCSYGGQNCRYDLRILSAEMARAGQPWSYAGARIIDSSKLEQIAVPRSLSHLHEKYVGHKHDGAHGALSDVRAAATVIAKQLETHDVLPRDLGKLHEMSWPGFIDSEGKFAFKDGVATVTFGKWRDKPMHLVERSYWTWLGGPKSGFSDEMREIANAAARGVFPEEKK